MIIGRFGIVGYLNVNPKFDIWAKRDYYQIDFGFTLFGISISMSYITWKKEKKLK